MDRMKWDQKTVCNAIRFPVAKTYEAVNFVKLRLPDTRGLEDNVLVLDLDGTIIEKARQAAARFTRKAKNTAKVTVLVPAGLLALKLGCGFPDLDISFFGIGAHRFFMFHSALAPYILEKFFKAYVASQKENPCIRDRVVKKLLGVMGGATSLGIGVHLLIDVFQPKSVVFPIIGSLLGGTLVDDNIWLLGNSLWCFRISHDFFVIAIGDDLEAVKRYVKRTFINALNSQKGPVSGPEAVSI